jgi:calcineurin-like phosphoesterase family protein
MIWFTSDTHFGHANIIKYCNRPFSNVQEMDEEMIKRWNDRVQHGDTVYHLGDFAFAKETSQLLQYVRRLNGQKFLVHGNHDRFTKQKRPDNYGFVQIEKYKEIKWGDLKINLLHYPMLTWNGSHRGSWHLHGHCHGKLKHDLSLYRFDVGVDVWNYAPISIDDVAAEMRKVTPKELGGHDL